MLKLLHSLVIALIIVLADFILAPLLNKTEGDSFVFLILFPLVCWPFVPLILKRLTFLSDFLRGVDEEKFTFAMSGTMIGVSFSEMFSAWTWIGPWKWLLVLIGLISGTIPIWYAFKNKSRKEAQAALHGQDVEKWVFLKEIVLAAVTFSASLFLAYYKEVLVFFR